MAQAPTDAAGNIIHVVQLADGTTVTQLLAVDSSGRITVIPGPQGAQASPWWVRLTDGTTPFQMTLAPGDATNDNVAGNNRNGLPVTAGMQGFAGSNWDRFRVVKTSKTATADGIGNASSLTVWTPALGKKFRLFGAVLRASAAGRYSLLDGAAVLARLYLATNSPLYFAIAANGVVSATANNTLALRNDSGSAADLDAFVWGLEE